MSSLALKKLATYSDLNDLPENRVGEIIHGELSVSPRPAAIHARASSRLGADLIGPFDRGKGGPGGWIILDEPELHIVGQVLVPDIAGWRRERMPQLPKVAAFELAPDWICEVLSESTAGGDRSLKMPLYAQAQVQHLWLVDPLVKTVEVYNLEGLSWRVVATYQGSAKVRAPPFEAVELDLEALWAT